jgi:nitroreductase
MELHEAIRRRAMVRSFGAQPIDPLIVDSMVEAALRAPSAGNTAGTAWVVLTGEAETAVYWSATTDAAWRSSSARSEGLRRAPVILLAYASASAYVSRYAEADKARADPRLGSAEAAWPVPYWTGDAAFGVMTVLLAAVDAGLGACILGNFRGEEALADALGVPASWRLFCAVPVGYPDGNDHPSRSLSRAVPGPEERIHRGRWRA